MRSTLRMRCIQDAVSTAALQNAELKCVHAEQKDLFKKGTCVPRWG